MRKALLGIREKRGAGMEWQRKERENIEELSSKAFTIQHTKKKKQTENKTAGKQQQPIHDYATGRNKSAKSLSASTHTHTTIYLSTLTHFFLNINTPTIVV